MRKVSGFLAFLAGLLLLTGGLLTCFQITINQDGYFVRLSQQFQTGQAVGITDQEAGQVLDHLVDYMEGREESIQMTLEVNGQSQELFTQDEITHMEDVQKLYQTARLGRDICLIGAAVLYLLVLLFGRPRPFRLWAGGYLASCGLTAVVGGGLTIWAVRDFNSFWTKFHQLLFSNDLWLMDPEKSKMILLCPAELFQSILRQGGLWTLSAMVLLAAISMICIIRRPRGGKREKLPVGGKGGRRLRK